MITEAEFLGMTVIALCTLFALISAVVVPLIKLNVTLAKLHGMLESMLSENKVRDRRINAHAEQLDIHEKILTEHEVRLKHLEDVT